MLYIVVLKYLCVYLTNKPICYLLSSFQFKIYPFFKILTTFPLASSTLILSSLWSMVTIMASPSIIVGLILVISVPANIIKIYEEHQTFKHQPLITILLHLITFWHSEIVLPMRISMSAIFSDSLCRCSSVHRRTELYRLCPVVRYTERLIQEFDVSSKQALTLITVKPSEFLKSGNSLKIDNLNPSEL